MEMAVGWHVWDIHVSGWSF